MRRLLLAVVFLATYLSATFPEFLGDQGLLLAIWVCSVCEARAETRPSWCPRCGGISTFLPAVWGPAAEVVQDTVAVTAKALYQATTRFIDLGEELARIIGRLPAEAFVLVFHGPPGSQKSTLLIRLSDRLCEVFGPVLVVSLEEGFGPQVSDRLRRTEIFREDLYFTASSDLRTILEIAERVGARAVFIDSLTESTLTAEDVARIVRETGLAIAYTLHSTKDGKAAGRMGLLHVADVVVRLESGRFFREKSRYAGTAGGEL